MKAGDKITFRQEGDVSPDTTPGDLIFVIFTMPHSRFERDGNDLKANLRITLLQVKQKKLFSFFSYIF
jgi:DnaJ-class molecular chaperone